MKNSYLEMTVPSLVAAAALALAATAGAHASHGDARREGRERRDGVPDDEDGQGSRTRCRRDEAQDVRGPGGGVADHDSPPSSHSLVGA